MTTTLKERYESIERYIRELPGNELKTALLASSIAMIEALDAAINRANAHAEREGWLEDNAGFRPVTKPPEGSQWEIVIPAVYLDGAFCVANKDGEPDTYGGHVLLMRLPPAP
jgi:hypothetical protein